MAEDAIGHRSSCGAGGRVRWAVRCWGPGGSAGSAGLGGFYRGTTRRRSLRDAADADYSSAVIPRERRVSAQQRHSALREQAGIEAKGLPRGVPFG